MEFGVRGVALLQVWLMIFGFVGIVFFMGDVSGAIFGEGGEILEGAAKTVNAPVEYAGRVGMDLGRSTASVLDKKVSSLNIPKMESNLQTSAFDYNEAAKEIIKKETEEVARRETGEKSKEFLSEKMGLDAGGAADALVTGLQWAAGAYFLGKMVGGMIGLSDDNTEAFSAALAAGTGVYNFIDTYSFASDSIFASGKLGFIGANPFWVGAAVGVVVFALMYKDTKVEVVTFNCMPWQAPTGGNNCEVCNDVDLPCSEYRCKALGQGCEIVNEGTSEEKCVYVNPRDTNPPVVSPDYDVLSSGYSYSNVKSSPPGPGFEIVNSEASDGCLKAFTPLKFGLSLDEPGQCKIDFNHTVKFDDMRAYVGGSNLFSYNHSEVINLPSPGDLSGSGFVLENGKDLTFFIRCRDKNGNENSAEYAVNFCVDPSPDTTAPKIEATSILNGGCVAEEQESADVVFYTNEPANCKWDVQDQDYDLMTNDMDCDNQFWQANAAQLFGCSAELTGIPRDGAMFYVRCKDQPGKNDADRNENRESFEFSLRGSDRLSLRNLQPNETIFGGVSPAPIELYVETLYGCDNGKAICAWSSNGNDYIEFFDTNNEDGIHTQRLDLAGGDHEYFVRCVDSGGNIVEDSISFNVDIDTSAPVIARIYEEGGMLKIITVRDSECSYGLDNCDFVFVEGIEMPYGNTTIHVAEWNEKNTYYIKCRDEFLNEESDCSAIVRPTENFL